MEFDSWEHALDLLQTTDLSKVSHHMRKHNGDEFKRIATLWRNIFAQIDTERSDSLTPTTADEAMKMLHGLEPLKADENSVCGGTTSFTNQEEENVQKKEAQQRKPNIPATTSSKCKGKTPEPTTQTSHVHNPVLDGTYRRKCIGAEYDSLQNTLKCKLDNRVLTLSDPYKCASDININAAEELQC